jgi:hypothetical protein
LIGREKLPKGGGEGVAAETLQERQTSVETHTYLLFQSRHLSADYFNAYI